MNKIIILLLFFMHNSCITQELRQKISGNVYDSHTKMPVVGVYVLSYQMDTLSITGTFGYFEIKAIKVKSISWPGIEKSSLKPHYDLLIFNNDNIFIDTINIYDKRKNNVSDDVLILDSILVKSRY